MLNVILKRAGVVTGPRRKHTSHSALQVIKRDLLGLPQFKGGEHFLKFGNALHEVFLKGDYTNHYRLLKASDKKIIDAMAKKLNSNPIVTSLMKNSIREHKFKVAINKVKVAVVLDSKQKPLKRGFDLKTTSCSSIADFESKFVLLDYGSQGLIYKIASGLNNFYVVGICKVFPYDIFIVDVDDKKFKHYNAYAKEQLKFLLYFYKNYGKTIRR